MLVLFIKILFIYIYIIIMFIIFFLWLFILFIELLFVWVVFFRDRYDVVEGDIVFMICEVNKFGVFVMWLKDGE